MGVALAEEGDQDRAGVDGLLAARLHLHGGPLQDPLESAGLLRIAVEPVRELRLAVLQVLLQIPLQLGQPRPAGAQDPGGDGVPEKGVEQVLQRDVFVPPRLRLREGEPQ